MKIKLAIIIFFLSILFTACVSINTIKQTIDNKATVNNNAPVLVKTDFLELKADSLILNNSVNSVKKKKSYVIPLIVYWGWKQAYECKLTNLYFIDIFNKVLSKKMVDFPYEKYLDDKKLIIELTSIPSTFNYSNQGSYIFIPYFSGFGIYYTFEKIYPENQQLKFKYQFVDKNGEIKKGENSFNFKNPSNSMFNPESLGIDYFIDDLKTEFEFQSNLLIDKVIDDL
ncbi:MAG TPA: hypothetical protein P5084_02275 [Paludibacter sp.]|nr:hypothetical protein [Paludibacter sp.]